MRLGGGWVLLAAGALGCGESGGAPTSTVTATTGGTGAAGSSAAGAGGTGAQGGVGGSAGQGGSGGKAGQGGAAGRRQHHAEVLVALQRGLCLFRVVAHERRAAHHIGQHEDAEDDFRTLPQTLLF